MVLSSSYHGAHVSLKRRISVQLLRQRSDPLFKRYIMSYLQNEDDSSSEEKVLIKENTATDLERQRTAVFITKPSVTEYLR